MYLVFILIWKGCALLMTIAVDAADNFEWSINHLIRKVLFVRANLVSETPYTKIGLYNYSYLTLQLLSSKVGYTSHYFFFYFFFKGTPGTAAISASTTSLSQLTARLGGQRQSDPDGKWWLNALIPGPAAFGLGLMCRIRSLLDQIPAW